MYQTLQECQDALSSYREGSGNTVAEAKETTVHIKDVAKNCIRNLQSGVKKMSNDLHTRSLLNSALPEALTFMNSSLSQLKKKQQQKEKQSVIQSLIEIQKEVRGALKILGLLSKLNYS